MSVSVNFGPCISAVNVMFSLYGKGTLDREGRDPCTDHGAIDAPLIVHFFGRVLV